MKQILLFLMMVAFIAACEKMDADCIDESQINPEANCTMEYDPVCGCDGKTYGNSCLASIAGVTSTESGECD